MCTTTKPHFLFFPPMYHTGNDETASHVLAKYFTTELDHLPTATINKIPSKQTDLIM